MPVTAKLSRRFYDRFGDEITNELVDWLNSVDATYQASLRELNEVNFARSDARMERRFAAFEARMDVFEARIEQRLTGLATKEQLSTAIAGLATKAELSAAIAALATKAELSAAIAGLATKDELKTLEKAIGRLEVRMLKWMVGLWSATILAVIGLGFGVLQAR